MNFLLCKAQFLSAVEWVTFGCITYNKGHPLQMRDQTPTNDPGWGRPCVQSINLECFANAGVCNYFLARP